MPALGRSSCAVIGPSDTYFCTCRIVARGGDSTAFFSVFPDRGLASWAEVCASQFFYLRCTLYHCNVVSLGFLLLQELISTVGVYTVEHVYSYCSSRYHFYGYSLCYSYNYSYKASSN